MLNLEKLNKDTIVFARHSSYYDGLSRTYISNDYKEPSDRILFLLSKNCENDFYENMPKTFTISTKNTTLHFNADMLKETSPVISKFIQDNPNENNFNISITDDDNILTKFEQLYQGKTIVFKEEELPLIQRFTNLLQIKNCPNELKPKDLGVKEIDSEGYEVNFSTLYEHKIAGQKVEIYQKWFLKFLTRDQYQSFKIITNKKEYKCNIFAVYTSNIIRQILSKDPTVKQFEYNFADTNEEFQLICDFFNYKLIDLKSVNIETLKLIAKDLQINCILKFIDNYNDHNNHFNQIVEKHKNTIDSINELFELLYNIKLNGIEKVKNSIVQSKWSKTEENVQELAAFILQVVKPSFSLQKEMAELLIQLNNESNNDNQLHVLIPFIVERLMALYWPNNSFYKQQLSNNKILNKFLDEIESINLNNRCVYSFIRILYKRGIIPKEEIIKSLKNYNFYNNTLNAFFLPELVEINPNNFYIIADLCRKTSKVLIGDPFVDGLFMNFYGPSFNFSKIAYKYSPNRIDLYEKMLDEMEPDNELTKALRNDDVDKLQKIIDDEGIDIQQKTVEYNIFDNLEYQSLINYSASYGSIKCFNYLLSNDAKIDDDTFYYAIYGGNKEIIEIVDTKCPKKEDEEKNDDNNKPFNYRGQIYNNINYGIGPVSFWYYLRSNKQKSKAGVFYEVRPSGSIYDKYNDENIQYVKNSEKCDQLFTLNGCNINNRIAPTISMHQNELFDWTFQNLFVDKNKYGNELKHVANLAAINGNIHSLLALINNGFQISKTVISFAAKNGFYTLTKLLLDLYEEKEFSFFDYKSIVDFGCLSTFKLFVDYANQITIQKAILRAIKKNCMSIIKYVFENDIKFDFIQFDDDFIYLALLKSLRIKTNLFNFLIDQFKKLNPNLITYDLFSKLLNKACSNSNLSATKIITDFIIDINPEYDFTNAFTSACSSRSSDICQYFIDKKVLIDFVNNSNISELGRIDIELFERIVNNVDPNLKSIFNECIYKAIQSRNVKVIEFILKEKPPLNTELFEAIQTNDVGVVDLILKYNSKPSFINQNINQIGSALCMAVIERNIEVVKRLLSIPEIDPYFGEYNISPIILATQNHDFEILDLLLNFCGDNIQYHLDMIIDIFELLHDESDIYSYINDNIWEIIKRFCEIKYFDVNLHFTQNAPILYHASCYNKIDLVEFLLKLENIDTNIYENFLFNTPLIIAINKKNVKIAELLIKHPKTNINMSNLNNETPLISAVKTEQIEIIDLLLNDKRFDPIESKLNCAFIYANNKIANKLHSLNYLDVNQQFGNNKINALYHSIQINDVDKIDLIIKHQSFNIYKSNIKRCIFLASEKNNIKIFQKLMSIINNDVNIVNEKHQSLIEFASKYLSGNIIDEIVSNERFDSKSEQILNAFIQSYSNPKLKLNKVKRKQKILLGSRLNYFDLDNNKAKVLNQESLPKKSSIIEIIEKIFNFDNEHEKVIKFDELLPNGKSFFTIIFHDFDGIEKVSEFLLSHGVDPNKPDKNGVYPLEHAIKINSLELVKSLVNTEKIEYNQIKNGNSYLHLAARNEKSSILSFLLQKKLIDVNSVNDVGETPLFEACKSKCIENIKLLFMNDSLDYLHCNKNGKNALDVVIKLPPTEHESIKQDREKYRNKLIAVIDEKLNSNDE